MTAIPYGAPQERWDEPEEEPTTMLPGRPRRRLWGPATAVLLAAVVGASCFYAGVRVEKGQLASAATGSSAATAGGVSARFAGAAGSGARSRATGAGAAAASGTGGEGGAGFARALGGGANGTAGTVSAVDGKTLYLSDFSGNTVKVTLSSATAVTKSQTVGANAVRPGDTVIVSGLKGSDGTITAASVSDNGNRGSGAGGSGSSGASGSSGGSGSSSSALNSLFGSGG